MTSYYSALFFTAFLPITVMLYGMAPRRFRWAVLLLASYGFFFALSGALIAFVALSTAVVYACARMMGANLAEKNRQLATASSGKREIREACGIVPPAETPAVSSSRPSSPISAFWPS